MILRSHSKELVLRQRMRRINPDWFPLTESCPLLDPKPANCERFQDDLIGLLILQMGQNERKGSNLTKDILCLRVNLSSSAKSVCKGAPIHSAPVFPGDPDLFGIAANVPEGRRFLPSLERGIRSGGPLAQR